MILLFNNIPVTLEQKIKIFTETVKQAYGSDFYDVEGDRWLGDSLTIESLFPQWIISESKKNEDVLITKIIKSYLRWLFSYTNGYGAAVPWELFRSFNRYPEKFYSAVADYYFPNCDFTVNQYMRDSLSNITKFAIQAEQNYVLKKGTMDSIRYVLTTLFNIPLSELNVYSGSPGFIIIEGNVNNDCKDFLNKHVYPAGMQIIYQS